MGVKLYNADCLDVMKSMPDKSAAAIVTDPPPHRFIGDSEWLEWVPTWFAEARRIAPIVIMMVGVKTMPLYPESDWIMCWWRADNNEKSRLGGYNQWLPILVYGKPQFDTDIKMVKAITNPVAKGYKHPSAKPVELMEWLISGVKEAGAIFDPFMGSGPVGVACVKAGRDFIGIEIDRNFYEVAEKNIARARKA